MSVPKSSVLSCSKGFLARVNTNVNSPKQTQSQNVNVVVNPYDQISVKYPDLNDTNVDNNPNNNNNVQERSVETAGELYNNLEKIIHDKDLLIQALVLCLDIMENNPLIINKFVIADETELVELIKLLCDTNDVELLKVDGDAYCCKSSEYDIISKILVKKDGNTYNLKYSYSDVMQLFYERKISTKFVKVA